MSFAIPRIQYKNLDTQGTTISGSGTIGDVPDTTDIEVGMFVRGSGVPTGAIVLSKTADTVTLAASVLATATADVDLYFGWEILFDYPPKESNGESLETNANISESLSGIRQVSINYTEGVRKLVFSFLSPTLFVKMDTFLKTSALLGESFRYFDDQTLSAYVECELDKLKVTPKKVAPRGIDTYVWEIPLELRRVL